MGESVGFPVTTTTSLFGRICGVTDGVPSNVSLISPVYGTSTVNYPLVSGTPYAGSRFSCVQTNLGLEVGGFVPHHSFVPLLAYSTHFHHVMHRMIRCGHYLLMWNFLKKSYKLALCLDYTAISMPWRNCNQTASPAELVAHRTASNVFGNSPFFQRPWFQMRCKIMPMANNSNGLTSK